MDIVATGMVCSVGLTAASACAAMRAKVARFDDLPYADNQGKPIVGAMVPGLDPRLTRRQRLVEMLAMALEDCLATGGVKNTEQIPLLVGLAEPGRPGGGEPWSGTIIKDIEARLDIRFDPERSTAIPKGHTAGFEAINVARELLKDNAVPACLVCGVDSYINASSLLWLERHDRLKTEENSDGVIPGEGAACVLVFHPSAKPRNGYTNRIAGLGFGREEASVLTEEPILGLGLADAGRAALSEAGLTMQEIDLRSSDLGGESYGFREQILLLCRLLKEPREFTPLWHHAESIGETGAASGIGQLVVIDQAFRKHYAPGKHVLCATSADSGDRAAVVLEHRHSSRADESDQADNSRERASTRRT